MGVGWLILAPASSGAGTLDVQDFAFGIPVVTTQDAAAYRMALPLAVYQGTVREDLGDLRIVNAQGEAVPYSLMRAPTPATAHPPAISLPLFPLRGGARAVIEGTRLTIDLSGGAGNAAINQYILDGRAVTSSVSALRLAWPENASDYSGRVKVEVSDDLGIWQPVVTAAPIANLHANGQALIENRVTLAPSRAKFWRLTWVGPAPNFDLTSISAEPADTFMDTARDSLEVTGVRDPADADTYSFDLGAHPPVSRVNISLPEANTLSGVEMSSRRTPRDPWRYITRGNFYRIKSSDGSEQHNASLDVGLDRDRYWRARLIHGGGLPGTPLRLHVEWVPTDVTFLAGGHAPFWLLYGNAAVIGAESDLSILPTATQIALATAGTQRAFGGAARLTLEPAPFPWARAALWALLFLAVGLLAWMALRLSQEKPR